ncbi:MAG: ribosome silencing factor [Chloroflexi bacterium]|nr:ribosome silencing factor [Chloroflexota bacterium]
MPKRKKLTIVDLAKKAVEAASDKQAADIVLLDLHGLASFTDYFVICTADNPRQLSAIANEVDEELTKAGLKSNHREGQPDSGWMLLDFGDIVVHIFSARQRRYYDLEAVWKEAPALVRMQ